MNKMILALLVSTLVVACGEKQKQAAESAAEQPSEQTTAPVVMPGVATDPKQTVVAVVTQEPTSLKEALMAEINAESCQSDADCGVVGIGHKPCGGAESYQVYSKIASDEKKLLELAEQYKQRVKAYQKEKQMVGICVVTPEPKASCQNNMCKAVNQQTSAL